MRRRDAGLAPEERYISAARFSGCLTHFRQERHFRRRPRARVTLFRGAGLPPSPTLARPVPLRGESCPGGLRRAGSIGAALTGWEISARAISTNRCRAYGTRSGPAVHTKWMWVAAGPLGTPAFSALAVGIGWRSAFPVPGTATTSLLSDGWIGPKPARSRPRWISGFLMNGRRTLWVR